MEPTKGRIVNYHCIEGEKYLGCTEDMILPAMIVAVYPGHPMKAVNLIVFTNSPTCYTFRSSIPFGLTNMGGWTWPERVEDQGKAVNKEVKAVKVGPAPMIAPKVS